MHFLCPFQGFIPIKKSKLSGSRDALYHADGEFSFCLYGNWIARSMMLYDQVCVANYIHGMQHVESKK